MKIGKTDFNQETVKRMSFDEFSNTFGHLNIDLSVAYFKLTGTEGKAKNKRRTKKKGGLSDE